MEIKISLDELEKLYFAFMIQLTSQEQRISLAIYQQLAKGQAVSHDQLASHLSLSKQIIDDFLLDHIGVYYDENQNIIGYLGLTLAKMGHKIYIDNRQLYTWCAWDSLFIPSLLSKPARVESICPVTNKKISLTISSKGVAEIEPSNVVVSMLIPESEDKLKENIIMNFCHHVHFFFITVCRISMGR